MKMDRAQPVWLRLFYFGRTIVLFWKTSCIDSDAVIEYYVASYISWEVMGCIPVTAICCATCTVPQTRG